METSERASSPIVFIIRPLSPPLEAWVLVVVLGPPVWTLGLGALVPPSSSSTSQPTALGILRAGQLAIQEQLPPAPPLGVVVLAEFVPDLGKREVGGQYMSSASYVQEIAQF